MSELRRLVAIEAGSRVTSFGREAVDILTGPRGATGATGATGAVYLDLEDAIIGPIYNGPLLGGRAARARRWTAGGATLGTASTTAVTLTINKNGAAAATLTIPANGTVSGALSAAVSFAAGDRYSVVLSGATGGVDLDYWLRGEPI